MNGTSQIMGWSETQEGTMHAVLWTLKPGN